MSQQLLSADWAPLFPCFLLTTPRVAGIPLSSETYRSGAGPGGARLSTGTGGSGVVSLTGQHLQQKVSRYPLFSIPEHSTTLLFYILTPLEFILTEERFCPKDSWPA